MKEFFYNTTIAEAAYKVINQRFVSNQMFKAQGNQSMSLPTTLTGIIIIELIPHLNTYLLVKYYKNAFKKYSSVQMFIVF